jgi:two-component system LytT family sensor kinase
VENAIKHGLAELVAGGEIRVAPERKSVALCLSVYNDGPDFAAKSKSAGVGLANLRTRLHIMHADAADLIVRSVAGHGVEVVVTLPIADSQSGAKQVNRREPAIFVNCC